MNHQRIARIDGIDLATGTFPMTLATEGEASDGHILSIQGGQIPERMPMLVSHWNDPSGTAGSIVEPQKRLKDSPPTLRAMGQIEMAGEGAAAEIRRDLAHMIDKGHVGAVSIRWDEVPGKSIQRVNLPSDHPFHVDAEASRGEAKRYGVFFQEWVAREGSIVALGADPGALIGRAGETEGDVATFWRAMAQDAVEGTDHASALAQIRLHAQAALSGGVEIADLVNAAVSDTVGDEELEPVTIDGRTFFLPAHLADRIEELETRAEATAPEPTTEEPEEAPAPEPREDLPPAPLAFDARDLLDPANVEALGALLSSSIDAYEQRIHRNVQALIDLRTGKVKHE